MSERRAVAVSQARSEINVTPLVDVCLVLLIIFMVVTPLLTPGAGVAVPLTPDPLAMAENPRQIKVAVRADGSIRLGERTVTESELVASLVSMDKERRVIVRADRRLRYAQVRHVLSLIEDAEFRRVGLVTERKAGAAP